MAFINVQKKLTSTNTAVYTSSASLVSIMFSGYIANISETNVAYVTVSLTQDTTTTYLFKNAPVPIGSALTLDKQVIGKSGILKAYTDINTTDAVDITLSILTTTE